MREGWSRACFRWWLRLGLLCWLGASLSPAASGSAVQPWPLWESYASKFLDAQGRVIEYGAEDRTTTEGQAYAMFFALVANDRSRFDKLVDWTEVNLAQGDLTLHLPAWNWGKAPDGSWRPLDTNSAADADLWMAYALVEAGRLWHDDRYAKLGSVIADRIAEQEIVRVPGVGTALLPGPKGFHPDDKTWFLNPSYMPPELIAYFAHRKPQSAWGAIATSLPALVAGHDGFVMDWMKSDANGIEVSAAPSAAQGDNNQAIATGSYDAVRLYLWAGIADPATAGLHELLQHITGMAMYLQEHITPPLRVDGSGKVLDADAPPGFSAAVIPYLHALGLKKQEQEQTDRLAATRDNKSGLYGRGGDYFDQNLALFQTGWTERRYRFEANGQLRVKWR